MISTKVSIIIPAYNTAEYIDDMLECVVNQTYRNLEIIVINDGSTDDTLEHIKNFESKDSRIKCIDITNSGVSNARNYGIKCATGEKIFFWDSDDIIELTTVEECLNFAEKENVSAVLYGYSNRVDGVNGVPRKSYLKKKYVGDEIRYQCIPCFIGHSFEDINKWIKGEVGLREHKESTALWRIMLDAQTIEKNKLLFDASLSLGEDTKFINTYFLVEKSVGYLNKCFYHLTVRLTGANMTSISNAELMRNNKIKLIDARKELDLLAQKQGFNLHKFWEGTMVFSAIQLIIKFAKDYSYAKGYSRVKVYLDYNDVKETIKAFKPAIGVKSIPFFLIKCRMSHLLYMMIKIMPDSIIKKLI